MVEVAQLAFVYIMEDPLHAYEGEQLTLTVPLPPHATVPPVPVHDAL